MTASENGHQEEKVDEPVKEIDDPPISESGYSQEEAQPQPDEATEKVTDKHPSADSQQLPSQNEDGSQEPSKDETQAPSKEETEAPSSEDNQQQEEDSSAERQEVKFDNETITRRMEVPNNKVCFIPAYFIT